MALATSTVIISRNLSFSARTLAIACTARPATLPAAAVAAVGGGLVRRSVSCSHVPRGALPAPGAESVFLVQKRRSSDKAHDAGCPCPSPCGPCGCPRGCGCLPPPCDLPPTCIQYMTGYYYYPYGTWFAGPYHVKGICQPIGKDSLSCDERGKAGCPPSPPKDCSPSPCCSPKPPACPSKPACPPKPSCPPKTCQAKPAATKPCSPPRQAVSCPPPKAKSLSEICKSKKKPIPPCQAKPSCPSAKVKFSPSIFSAATSISYNPTKASPPPATSSSTRGAAAAAVASCLSPAANSKSSTGVCSSKDQAASTANTDKMTKSILDLYLKSPQKNITKLTKPNSV